jgi:Flp pilus assembly protein TadG
LTRAEGDRGAIALFAVVTVTALFLAIGLAVDGGAKIHAMQRADAIAAEAARTGAQRIIIDGNGAGHPTINPAEACSAAQAYVSAAQRATFVSCSLVNSTTIRVEAAVAYDNVFLSLVGPATGQENGSAQARLARGVGSEQ